ncbi:hypothetical protein R6Q57_027267 [Mikania cordata]
MFRSVSTSRVSDDTYYSIYSHSPTSKAVSPALRALALEANEVPQHESSPFSMPKKDKFGRSRFSEKSVHVIPLILLLCALVLWLFSNPDINMSIKNDLTVGQIKQKVVDTSATIKIKGTLTDADFGISEHEETTTRAKRKRTHVASSPSRRFAAASSRHLNATESDSHNHPVSPNLSWSSALRPNPREEELGTEGELNMESIESAIAASRSSMFCMN